MLQTTCHIQINVSLFIPNFILRTLKYLSKYLVNIQMIMNGGIHMSQVSSYEVKIMGVSGSPQKGATQFSVREALEAAAEFQVFQ